ncbi:MAG: DUF6249 domain-containing protein [Steroidobacteraceae bacterium]
MVENVMVFLVPIVAIVMGVGFGMLGLLLDYRKKCDIFELHHKERMAAIEKGMEVPPLPPQLFMRGGRSSGDLDCQLRSGLILLFVGIAVGVALYATDGHDYAWWGLVPAAVGLAKLLYVAISRRSGLSKHESSPGQ